MTEHRGDLFEMTFEEGHRIGISTNGTIKRNGEGVMGRGCALEASIMYPEFPRALGVHLKAKGNVPGYVTVGRNSLERTFLVLPVKHNWHEQADIDLIIMSTRFLRDESQAHPEITFHVPRLGCGNGRLSWDGQVKPLMLELADNVVVHH